MYLTPCQKVMSRESPKCNFLTRCQHFHFGSSSGVQALLFSILTDYIFVQHSPSVCAALPFNKLRYYHRSDGKSWPDCRNKIVLKLHLGSSHTHKHVAITNPTPIGSSNDRRSRKEDHQFYYQGPFCLWRHIFIQTSIEINGSCCRSCCSVITSVAPFCIVHLLTTPPAEASYHESRPIGSKPIVGLDQSEAIYHGSRPITGMLR